MTDNRYADIMEKNIERKAQGMDLQGYLNQRGISKYRLAQISGVPNTTIVDICAGRSEIVDGDVGDEVTAPARGSPDRER